MNLREQKEMSEEDVKRLFIRSAIEAKWDKDRIRMEAKITDGRVNILEKIEKALQG